jgi:cobalt-zinc-cadmium efflux system membrane fusion protein
MQSSRRRPTILVVDDDEVLLGVLSRVLTRAGYNILTAANVAEALQQADGAPQLALLDLSLPDGDGVDLGRVLRARHPDLPLILMTGCPTRLREHPEVAGEFVRVLTKPMNLEELRQVLKAVLPEGPMIPSSSSDTAKPMAVSLPSNSPPAPSAPPAPWPVEARPAPAAATRAAPPAVPARRSRWKAVRSGAAMALIVLVLTFFLAFVAGVPLPGLASAHTEETAPPRPPLAVELVKGQPHTLAVPEDVRVALGIHKGKEDRIAVAKVPTATRPLVLSGSTALDPTKLMRIRARFAPAEVVKIGQVREDPERSKSGQTEYRELRSGDHVKKGDLLGVFYSVDVGSKKNDLIDALVQLKLDEEVLERAQRSSHAIPEVFLLNAQRNVEGDHNNIARALNTLKVWGIPQEDIDAVYKEAEEISKRKGKRNPTKTDEWARVALRAPDDGVIVERNVSLHEMVVDNTINLFQIAKVERLTVLANAPEDDLPTLLRLPAHLRTWVVRTVGTPAGEGIPGTIDDISYLIDVNQHNAVVKGHIDNPEGRLRGGQFVSCTVQLPPPEDVVEVPVSAVVDDGRQCVVFVQPDPARSEYTMRRVEVSHRFEKTLFVRSRLTAKQQELTADDKEQGLLPRTPLRPGERVLTTGVLELKRELEDRESKSKK